MTISVSKCLLPTADGVVCGVQIEPFGAVRRLDTGQSVSLEDAENTLLEGNSDAPFQLRMRWYRFVPVGKRRGCSFLSLLNSLVNPRLRMEITRQNPGYDVF